MSIHCSGKNHEGAFQKLPHANGGEMQIEIFCLNVSYSQVLGMRKYASGVFLLLAFEQEEEGQKVFGISGLTPSHSPRLLHNIYSTSLECCNPMGIPWVDTHGIMSAVRCQL